MRARSAHAGLDEAVARRLERVRELGDESTERHARYPREQLLGDE